MRQLTANVYVETDYRGAIVGCLATDDGAALIDTPWRPTDAVAWRQQIAARWPIRYVINTHWHRDHSVCNFLYDAPVAAHEKTREAMRNAGNDYFLARLAEIDPAGAPLLAGFRL